MSIDRYIKVYILSSVLLYSMLGKAQTLENPIIQQYSNKKYQGSVSNDAIKQNVNGLLYIGNHSGLLEYDGVGWQLNKIGDGLPVFEIAISQKDQIYLGSENDFGYITVNTKGQISYHSLSKEFEKLEFGRINSIVSENSQAYYITLNQIFQYSNNELRQWDLTSRSIDFGTFIHNEELHFFIVGEGLFKINKQGEIEIVNSATQNDRILKINYTTNNTKLLLSAFGRQYTFQNDSIKKIHPYSKNIEDSLASQISKDVEILDKPGSQIIASRKNGIYFIEDNHIKHNSTQANGLSNNDIRDIQIVNNDLWLTNRDGINKIEDFGIWSYWGKKDNLNGTVTDLIKTNNNLLISTSSGLLELSDDRLSLLGNNNESFHNFFRINNQLFVNLFSGTSEISNIENKIQLDVPNYTVVNSDSTSIVMTRSGLHLLRLNDNRINTNQIVNENIGGISKSALLDIDNNVWFGINNSGLVKISSDLGTTKFNISHGLPDVIEPHIFQNKDALLFATGSGFYKLTPLPKPDSSDLFIPDYSLIKERIGITHPVTDFRGNIWYVATYDKSNTYVEKLELQSDSSYLKVTQPFKRLPQQEFTKIYPDPVDEGMIWIAGTEGLYRFNDNIEVNYDQPFNTLVRKVHTRDSLIFAGTYYNPKDTATVPSIVLDQPSEFMPSLTYKDNEISFDFAATSYEAPERTHYSYLLKGNEEQWSQWHQETKKEYTNLSPGDYTFMVKSKNIYDVEGRIASYQFTILPPWWMTSWAYALYIVGGVFTFWMFTLIYTYRIRVQRRKLKLIVADRTYEVMKQSKEIEKQNDLLKEQKEEITQHLDNISEKNQELESSQEQVLAVNSKLKTLNDDLEIQVDTRTKKIKSTLERLRKTNKELDTFIYRASHDLKGPISRIMGLSVLAKLEAPDSTNQEYFDMIEFAANDMKKLLAKLTQVHELLNKSVVMKEIDVPTLLGDVKKSLNHLDRKGDIKYSFNIKDQLSIRSDEDIIKVIIENLLENAIIFRKEKFKDSHHISIQLLQKDKFIHIVIRDNGIGVDPEHFDQLFDMFFRASDQSKGTGLGLYLVKMAVDHLQGSLSVDSTLGEFTEFTITLPI